MLSPIPQESEHKDRCLPHKASSREAFHPNTKRARNKREKKMEIHAVWLIIQVTFTPTWANQQPPRQTTPRRLGSQIKTPHTGSH